MIARIILVLTVMVCGSACSDARAFSDGASRMHLDLAKQFPVTPDTLKFPSVGCVRSVGATHSLREVSALVPEGERDRARPQDTGWMPEEMVDLAHRGQYYAIVDRKAAQVYLMDSAYSGRRTIGRKGSGPGEMQMPVAVEFDPRGDTLWVLDNGRHVILGFTTQGRFVRELRAPSRTSDLALASDGSIYVAHELLIFNARGGRALISKVGPTPNDTTPVVTVDATQLLPPRFVLPGTMSLRIRGVGPYIAVLYQAAGVVELYEKKASSLSLVSTIKGCVAPEIADALEKQRVAKSGSQSWVSLVTDVMVRGDTLFLINNREDKNKRYAVQRFLARTGADAGAIVMNSGPIKLPEELRFGADPTDIVSFSQARGVVIRFDASRKVN